MIRRKNTESARAFWAGVDRLARQTDGWPAWKRISMADPPVAWSDPEDRCAVIEPARRAGAVAPAP